MWKIIFSDIDGTLLNKERALSDLSLNTFKALLPRTELVLISSRMPKGMIYFQEEIGNTDAPLVCYNGGLILKKGKDLVQPDNILLDVFIPYDIVKFIADYLKSYDVNTSIYSYDDWLTYKMDYWTNREINNTRVSPEIITPDYFGSNHRPAHKIMVMGDKEELDRIWKYLLQRFEKDITLYRSKDTYIEISSSNISKGQAVNQLLDTLYKGIPSDATIGFGDNYNDVSLFEAVGHSVAVANAKPELLKLADSICLSNLESGVAKFLNMQ